MGKSGAMPPPRNVLFITLDQWRGDCLSALGHPLLQTPTLDALAARGVLFANHWANAAPCGPSRACLYTGTYQHRNRSLLNGTPLDARFTNVALIARAMGYDPVLFGYTDTSVDPRTVPAGDPRLFSYEGVLPGFRALIEDPWEQSSPAWGRWLAARGFDVPANPHDLYEPMEGFPGRRRSRLDLGARPLPGRALADLLRPFGRGRLSRAARRRALLRARLLHPAPPAAAQPGRLPRPLRGGGRRPLHRRGHARGGGGHPSLRRHGHGPHPGDQRAARRGRAPPDQGHLLRRPARGRRRPGPALRLPRVVGSGRIDPGRPDQRPRRNGRRPLAAREARVLGRELPRAADRGGSPALGRRDPGPGDRRRDRVGRRAPDHLRLHRGRGPAPSRRLVAGPVPREGTSRPSTGATRPTSSGPSRIRCIVTPSRRSASP